MMLRIVICDDNQNHIDLYSKQMQAIIDKHNLDLQICLATTDPHEVLIHSLNKSDQRYAYFLDVDLRLPDLNGLTLAAKIREKDPLCYFVFITAHIGYAMLSFKVNTFDFLVKPVNYETLENTLLSLHKTYKQQALVIDDEHSIAFQSGNKTHMFRPVDIICMEKMKDILTVHTTGKSIQCYASLKNVESELPCNQFFRCHRSFIINLAHIKEYDRVKNEVILTKNIRCAVSRGHRKELLEYVTVC